MLHFDVLWRGGRSMNMNRVPRNMVTYVVSMYIVRRDDDGRNASIYGVTQNSITLFFQEIYILSQIGLNLRTDLNICIEIYVFEINASYIQSFIIF